MKRFFDIVLSLAAMIILLPFMLPVMLILKGTGEHYIFYSQKRIGKHGKEFKLLKFATMLKDSPNLGTGDLTLKNDNRVLPFGKFLRKTKINELPQLINIFIGNMSVVGPRPLTPRNFNGYSPQDQEVIIKMRPGLTGVGSIIFRSEEKLLEQVTGDSFEFYKNTILPYKAQLEQWYYKKQSFVLYIMIIVITAVSLFFPKNRLVWKVFKDLPALPDELGRLYEG